VVYRTKNNQLLREISEAYFAKEPKIKVSGEFKAKVGEPVELSVWVEPGERMAEDISCGVHCFGETAQRAEKQPMREERLRAALEKTGDTPFYFSQLEIKVFGEIFIPVSALNALRREALDAIAGKIAAGYRRKLPVQGQMQDEGSLPHGNLTQRELPGDGGATAGHKECPGMICNMDKPEGKVRAAGASAPEIHVTVIQKGQLDAVLRAAGVRRIYYDLAALPVGDVPAVAARAKEAGKEFFLRLPRICRAETCDFLREEKNVLLGASVDGYLLQNYEELFLFAKEWRVQEKGKRLVTDAMLYAMNAQAKQFFRGLGVAECTAPYEENARELKELGIQDMALVVYGRMPLMTSAQCVYKNTKGCPMRGAGADKEKGQQCGS
ncbi:MAG: DUF3656 domain-containing protein, partial [Lachnospiraceae bacterium]|nr:DUF3656 domain-containing protein [Lachnospiraceae bacterium]